MSGAPASQGTSDPTTSLPQEQSRLAALQMDVSLALVQASDLQAMLGQCAAALVRHLDAAFARIWTLAAAEPVLELQASAGQYTRLDGPHGRVPVGRLKIGRIAAERSPHLSNAVVGDPEVSDQAWAQQEGMVAFAGYPLVVEDRLVGVTALFARQPLTEMTLAALAAVANSIALGIERVRAETRLREEAQLLETLHRVGATLAAELDEQRLLQAITDAATELTGAAFGAFFYNVVDRHGEAYQLSTLSGVPRATFERFPMPRNTAFFAPTFRGARVVRLADVTADTRFGENTPYQGLPPGHLPVRAYLAVPIMSRSGAVLGGLFFGHPQVGVFGDRAERLAVGVAAQAAIALDNARLYREAQDARHAAEAALRVRDEFLRSVTHDLRTPLTTIKGTTQLLARQVGRDHLDATRLAVGLASVERATGAMLAMVNELVDLSRLEAGQPLELTRAPTDLVALAQQVVADHARSAPQHTLQVTSRAPELVGLYDADRLERVLWNLVSNAIKYSPDGGPVTIALAEERGEAAGVWARIDVRDEGLGIPAADLPHIFASFHRGANVAGRIGGAGIGLAGAQRIVQQHDGTINVQSEEGRGTTVTVCLPLI